MCRITLCFLLGVMLFARASTTKGGGFDDLAFEVMMDDWVSPGQSFADYMEHRRAWVQELEEAKRAVAACNGCSSAKAKLEAMQAEESRFQESSGRLLGATGVPKEVARLMGIRTDTLAYNFPMARTSYEMGEGLVDPNPRWLLDAPPGCLPQVRDHLTNWRALQDRFKTSHVEEYLAYPGAPYYEAHRLYMACKAGDESEIEQLRILAVAREEGRIIPELEPTGPRRSISKGVIYFGPVPEDYVPPMPSAEDVEEKLAEPGVRKVSLVMDKKIAGSLVNVKISRLLPIIHLDSSELDQCWDIPVERRTERQRRFCEDEAESGSIELRVLACGYRAFMPVSNLPAQRSYFFWYNYRPQLVSLEYLLRRDHEHPFLVVGDARTECPSTESKALDATRAYEGKLVQLQQSIQQIPMTTAIPSSPYIEKRRQIAKEYTERWNRRLALTKDYVWPGLYRLDYASNKRGDLNSSSSNTIEELSADCVIASTFPETAKHLMVCWTGEDTIVGFGIKASGFSPRLPGMPNADYYLDEDGSISPMSVEPGAEALLRRIGDIKSFRVLPLEGDYLLTLIHDDVMVRALCSFKLSRYSSFELECFDRSGRHFSSIVNAIYSTSEQVNRTDANRVGEAFQISFLAKGSTIEQYQGRVSSYMVGDVSAHSLFSIIDPQFKGENLTDARLLIFSESGILGWMERVRTSDTTEIEEPSSNGLTGRWVGRYECVSSRQIYPVEVELELVDSMKGGFRAVTGRVEYRDTRLEVTGSHTVYGDFLGDLGLLRLQPGEIIEKPRLYAHNPVGFYAAVHGTDSYETTGAAKMTGDVIGNSCAGLALERVSSEYEVPQQTSTSKLDDRARLETHSSIVEVATEDPGDHSRTSPNGCVLEKIAGNYKTTYGLLECVVDGLGLECCYGRRGDGCVKAVKLAISSQEAKLMGEWSYTSGRRGPVEFGLGDDCALKDGLWGTDLPNQKWQVMGRQ